jgi:hypothetical protein
MWRTVIVVIMIMMIIIVIKQERQCNLEENILNMSVNNVTMTKIFTLN